MNRIEHWWQDVMKWKARFEKLFTSMGIHPGQAFQKELLKNYKKILSAKVGNMTPEERLTRKMVKEEYKKLNRNVYPNPVIRYTKNLLGIAISGIKSIPLLFKVDTARIIANNSIEKLGLDNIKIGSSGSLKSQYIESSETGERVNFKLKYKIGNTGKPELSGYDVKLINAQGKSEKIFIDVNVPINKYQVRELLSGRSVNIEGNKWLMTDKNDRDAEGNLSIKEVNITNFNLNEELSKIPGITKDIAKLEELRIGIANGKRVEIQLTSGSMPRHISIEANPIKRELILFENKKRIPITELENIQKRSKVLKMKPPTKRSIRMKM
jgi:hypothetical protein